MSPSAAPRTASVLQRLGGGPGLPRRTWLPHPPAIRDPRVRRPLLKRALNDAGCGVPEEDREHMRLALDLASRGLGQTDPNPAVGCVIVQTGAAGAEVVGRGFHPRAGAPHAEVFALRGAGVRAAGATAYVTLEPCSHHGRTPPCAEALLAAGVARVVVGVGDSNPLVGGAGVALLRQAGVEVAVGCEEEACTRINADFFARMEAERTGLAGGEDAR